MCGNVWLEISEGSAFLKYWCSRTNLEKFNNTVLVALQYGLKMMWQVLLEWRQTITTVDHVDHVQGQFSSPSKTWRAPTVSHLTLSLRRWTRLRLKSASACRVYVLYICLIIQSVHIMRFKTRNEQTGTLQPHTSITVCPSYLMQCFLFAGWLSVSAGGGSRVKHWLRVVAGVICCGQSSASGGSINEGWHVGSGNTNYFRRYVSDFRELASAVRVRVVKQQVDQFNNTSA